MGNAGMSDEKGLRAVAEGHASSLPDTEDHTLSSVGDE
jgi:hypothetical protein